MNYGGGKRDMGLGAIQAAEATYQQSVSVGMTSKIGITPMIGNNDVQGEVFDQANAQRLMEFVKKTSWVSSVSFWSTNRDFAKSGPLYASSQIAQTDYEFAKIFNQPI
jgi:hypothetical protein